MWRCAQCGILYRMTVENPTWQKASGCSGGQCVWVAENTDRDSVLVRDASTTEPLRFAGYAWSEFLDGLNAGDFRL